MLTSMIVKFYCDFSLSLYTFALVLSQWALLLHFAKLYLNFRDISSPLIRIVIHYCISWQSVVQKYSVKFVKFAGKYMSRRPATLLKTDPRTGVFLWTLQNFEEHLRTAVYVLTNVCFRNFLNFMVKLIT